MAFKDFLLENIIKGLMKNYGRNRERLIEIFRNIHDFNKSELLNLYIEFCTKEEKFSIDEYNILVLYKNVSADVLLNDPTIIDLLSSDIAYAINYGSIGHIDLILELLENQALLNAIISKVNDINGLGNELIRKYLNDIYFEKKLIIFQKLGFRLEWDLEKDKALLFNEEYQKKLLAHNLVAPEIVSQMYRYKYEKFKETVKKGNGYGEVFLPYLPISPSLMPLEADEMANYWREQSEQLGFDALSWVMTFMSYVENGNTFSEESLEEFIQRQTYQWEKDDAPKRIMFTPDGLPTKNLFNNSSYSSPMRKILYSYWEKNFSTSIIGDGKYNVEMVQYFLANIDKVEDPNLKGLLKCWEQIGQLPPQTQTISYNEIEQNRLLFMKFATGNHNIQLGLFDENGMTEKFYEEIIKYPQCYSLLPILDSKWEEHYTAKQMQYMQYLSLAPELANLFWNIKAPRHHDNYLEYFDEFGLTDDFYKGLLYLHPSTYQVLDKIKDSSQQHYTNKELIYIKLLQQHQNFFRFFLETEDLLIAIENFIDENGFNNNFYHHLLNFPDTFNEIIGLGDQIEQHYNNNELFYVKSLAKYPLLRNAFSDSIENIFSNDFDELGVKPHILKKAFNVLEWEFLIELSETRELVGFNEFEYKALAEYQKISDCNLRGMFKEFVMNNQENISLEKLELLSSLLMRIEYSNSTEISNFKVSLASQLLALDNPLASLEKIEEVFLKNNLPVVGKVYSVFEILHPNSKGFDYSSPTISPVLKKVGSHERTTTIFADLLKASLGSNNRSMREYLENIEIGNEIFQKLNMGEVMMEELEPPHLQILSTYLEHLSTLYNNTLAGKVQSEPHKLTGNIEVDMQNLVKLFSETGELDYNMPDRIVKMFGYFAGITTFEQAKKYFIERPQMADKRNREKANGTFTLEVGDFVKGINNIKYLQNILQNGSVAKEFLGDDAGSDLTPLDTDLSQIQELGNSIGETLSKTAASIYGNIWLVLKNDARFYTTRTKDKTIDEIDQRTHRDQLEVFYTGAVGDGHYGIRTGFASSEIDYIMCEEYDRRIGIEIAKNGFYIPVVDKSGKIVFSAKDYDEIRMQMGGLNYYQAGPFNYSDSLISEQTMELADQIPDNIVATQMKRDAINVVIANAIRKVNLALKTTMDGDLTEGSVELIDTGSTARGTNMIGDGDFDLLMRVDKTILLNPEKLNALKEALKEALADAEKHDMTSSGDFRYKKVNIPGLDIPVDIDITFAQKTNKTTYSTEMALNERLASIQNDSPKQYALVAANIIMAKKFLKEAGCYKPNRGEVPQGGLGGVGIENWILANGGSFEQAARSFLTAAEGKPFEEFRKSYGVYDFGQNHMATKTGDYPYDNFVTRNMSETGYAKMKAALKQYLLTLEQEKEMKK